MIPSSSCHSSTAKPTLFFFSLSSSFLSSSLFTLTLLSSLPSAFTFVSFLSWLWQEDKNDEKQRSWENEKKTSSRDYFILDSIFSREVFYLLLPVFFVARIFLFFFVLSSSATRHQREAREVGEKFSVGIFAVCQPTFLSYEWEMVKRVQFKVVVTWETEFAGS